MHIELLWMLAVLVAGAFACQWLAWRVRIPAILFLLLAGLALGPFTNLLNPDRLLGDLLFPVVSLAVAVILFEGSLSLRLRELRGIGAAVHGLVTYGALAALGLLAVAAHWIGGLAWPVAFLFGALTAVTGPTVIVPMLRTVRPTTRIANVLRWEGIILDPLGALTAVLIYEFIVARAKDHPLGFFLFGLACGVAIGAAAALVLAFLLRRRWIPEYLQPFGALGFVFVALASANAITHDSGLLAVTVMGMLLANLRGVHLEGILAFVEPLVVLLVSMLFILLAARLPWPLPGNLLLVGFGLFVFAQFIARPLSALLATAGSRLAWPERALIAWVAPRGIVAASVSAVFALQLHRLGVHGGNALVPLVFIMIIGTVVVQGLTARPLARRLGVAQPEPRGVLVYGADRVARTLAAALMRWRELRVVVADDHWEGVSEARMAGIETFFGNPVSRRAEHGMDLTGIGHLLALSPRRELNALACMYYRGLFGRDGVYRLRNLSSDSGPERDHYAGELRAPALFSPHMTHARFLHRLAAGWRCKATRLSKAFGWDEFLARYGAESEPLFGLDERGALRVASEKRAMRPAAGWRILALVPPHPGA